MRLRVCILTILAASLLGAEPKEIERVKEAATVFDEVMGIKERTIPQELLDKAECVVIVPSVKKLAFGLGGKYGKGVISCRPENGQGWSGPSTVRVEGGSFGFQIGGTSTDVVMLVMNKSGVSKLLQSKFTLGADMSVAAGPVGRDAQAETDAQMRAEMLAYSRSRGLFAGVSLAGATLRQDADDNEHIYGKKVTPKEILMEEVKPPASVRKLIDTLDKYSSRRKG
ncbi:MAG TPA: lipid-binding SYLF domain-containing protein [Bryobacterales bacterium]|nr:lipid-binding SYLF domain-containing protein [Bryobacterales bacterium]